jgi:hypothetical protein
VVVANKEYFFAGRPTALLELSMTDFKFIRPLFECQPTRVGHHFHLELPCHMSILSKVTFEFHHRADIARKKSPFRRELFPAPPNRRDKRFDIFRCWRCRFSILVIG